jgi:transcriptional antiterminator
MKQADLEEISKLLEDNHSVNPKDYEVLKDFSAEVDLKKIKEIIYSQEIKGKFLFTQISILAIIFYISISIKRFKQGKKIKLLEKDIIRLKRLKLFKLAKIIGKKAEEEFGFLISEDELCGTFIQFLCANIYYDNTLTTKEEISKRINKTVMEISRRFIDLVEDELGVNLADDINLFLDLILHVRHIYNHFRYQVPKIVVNELDNIILNRIKENNPNIIEISNKIIDIFSQYQINILSERDIDYIAILLLSAVEKFTEKTKAIIINNETFAINELMINRLISSISNLEIIDHIYNQDINHKKLKGADLIITSNQLVTLPEAIVISPLVKQEDIQLIRSRIKLLAEDKAL